MDRLEKTVYELMLVEKIEGRDESEDKIGVTARVEKLGSTVGQYATVQFYDLHNNHILFQIHRSDVNKLIGLLLETEAFFVEVNNGSSQRAR